MRVDPPEATDVGGGPSLPGAASRASDPTESGAFGVAFGRGSRILALLAVVGSFVMPPHGIGFSICMLNRFTGLPCPGCGMTRSFACLSHGRWLDAVHYHPFGPMLYAWAWLGLVATLAGPERRARVAAWFEAHPRLVRTAWIGFCVAFLAFGLVRLGSRIWWRWHGTPV